MARYFLKPGCDLPYIVMRWELHDEFWTRGDRFLFKNENGHDHEREHAAKVLTQGRVYTLKQMDIGGWSSQFELFEHEGKWFNHVMFDKVKEE